MKIKMKMKNGIKIGKGIKKMKTEFIKIESEDKLPDGVIRNTTRPNLFGCLFTNTETLEVERDIGILEKEDKVVIFKKILDDGFVELLNMPTLEYNIPLGKHVYIRKADVIVYYIKTKSELELEKY